MIPLNGKKLINLPIATVWADAKPEIEIPGEPIRLIELADVFPDTAAPEDRWLDERPGSKEEVISE